MEGSDCKEPVIAIQRARGLCCDGDDVCVRSIAWNRFSKDIALKRLFGCSDIDNGKRHNEECSD